MREFKIGEKVFGRYGVESYITGEIVKIDGNKISFKCNDVIATLNWDDVFYHIPEDRKKLFTFYKKN